jgi:hypothetical protein
MKLDGLTVYVPVAGSRLRGWILPGSGIVGTVQPGTGRVLIDYEGNKYGAASLGPYEERVYHAHDRHTWRGRGYPTIARALVPFEELIEVGFYDPETRTVHIDRQDVVDDWLAAAVPS